MTGDGEDNDCDGREDEDECFSGYGVYGSGKHKQNLPLVSYSDRKIPTHG